MEDECGQGHLTQLFPEGLACADYLPSLLLGPQCSST
jgi:hypothetical protein